MDDLIFTILAVTFIEVKILLYLTIKVLISNYQNNKIEVLPEDSKEEPYSPPKSYDDLVGLVNKL